MEKEVPDALGKEEEEMNEIYEENRSETEEVILEEEKEANKHHKKQKQHKKSEKWQECSKEELVSELDEMLKKEERLETEIEKLKQTAAEKEQESLDYLDRYRRALAETENIRKRSSVEKQDALKFGNFNIISDLLTILDDFDRALESGKQESANKQVVIEGVEMIEKQFQDLLFKKYGVEKFGEVGEEFDPNRYQAVMMEMGDYKEETVIEVFRKGYCLHERVIRPSQVKIGKPE